MSIEKRNGVERNKSDKKIHTNIKTFVKVECMRLESFDIKVGVHQR